MRYSLFRFASIIVGFSSISNSNNEKQKIELDFSLLNVKMLISEIETAERLELCINNDNKYTMYTVVVPIYVNCKYLLM